MKGENNMKYKKSKIGEYGIRWKAVEGYKTKKGKIVYPHLKKEIFKWEHYN